MASHFEPMDKKEHELAGAGYDVPDRCINCKRPFMDHTNGVCPKEGPSTEVKFIQNEDPAVEGWYIIHLDDDGTSYDQIGPYQSEDEAWVVYNQSLEAE